MKNTKLIIVIIIALMIGGIAGAWTYHSLFSGVATTKQFFGGTKGINQLVSPK
ncbi:hypothetical protein ICN48_10640 [Polynucleobacter sp. JS-Safj-400b-B2]|uniref:hypothetical protein n=1 Tax=Polynucleobacter sp. JS-Safj-400b-B2 TaxID=2576921 RepID=UPI001C0DC5F3|nr:hypothetical protein [Polynucleobacter sp. JS-Safj-400b-B2]MBU3626687.1 hypothetical protein [Polynucleobacter sp. JS-Safj-400b-B2]